MTTLFDEKLENEFGFKACYDAVTQDIEKFGKNPIYLLGKFTLRAKQDIFFNRTMIIALEKYIEIKGIKWDFK